jgi:hypothetical protein
MKEINNSKDADLILSDKDKNILRKIALEVADLANRPIEKEKEKLWLNHNKLVKTVPPVFCDPEHGWTEIIPQDSLLCENERARKWEYFLRKEVFWGAIMQDDRVIEPYFRIPYEYVNSGWGLQEIRKQTSDEGSYVWEAPIDNYSKLSMLHFPEINVDYDKTKNILDLLNSIFGDKYPTRINMGWWWSLGLTQTLVYLRGLEQMMLDMQDEPENLHRLMSILRDGSISYIEFLEKNGLLFLNNDSTYVGSGGFGWTDELPQKNFNGKVRLKDMWGFCESQETLGVSPKMFEEFVFQYQLPILEKFGLCCYGCCEPLEKRWEIIKKIPNLRRVSCSPFSNWPEMAEKLGNNYIFSMKPTPADLADTFFDENKVRDRIREGLKAAKNCIVEIIMKDNHTIRKDPSRVIRWVKIAKEEAENF